MNEVYQSRQFIVFNMSEINQVDFSKVLETSPETLRKSVDGTKSFVKWDGDITPEFVSTMSTVEGPYTYEEMLILLSTVEWTPQSLGETV